MNGGNLRSERGQSNVVILMVLFSVACSVFYFIHGWIQEVKDERIGAGRHYTDDEEFKPEQRSYTVRY